MPFFNNSDPFGIKKIKQQIPNHTTDSANAASLAVVELKCLSITDHEHPLISAAKENNVSEIKNLVKAGGNPNQRSRKYHAYTPLMCAAERGHLETVTTLLSSHSEINASNAHGHTALTLAALNGHFFCVQALLQKGADPDKSTNYETTALHFAASSEYPEANQIVKALLIYKANPNAQTQEKITPFMLAAENGNMEIVATLLNESPAINHQSLTGHTALMKAAKNGHSDVVKQLIHHGVEINKRNDNGETALIIAYKNKQSEAYKLLLSHGATINGLAPNLTSSQQFKR